LNKKGVQILTSAQSIKKGEASKYKPLIPQAEKENHAVFWQTPVFAIDSTMLFENST